MGRVVGIRDGLVLQVWRHCGDFSLIESEVSLVGDRGNEKGLTSGHESVES